MRTTNDKVFNIDSFVETIRNPYCDEGGCGYIISANSVHHATKAEIVWALTKLFSCLAVIAIALYCCAVVDGPFWRLVTSIVSMLACFCMHCFAAYKLENRHDTKT